MVHKLYHHEREVCQGGGISSFWETFLKMNDNSSLKTGVVRQTVLGVARQHSIVVQQRG